MEFNITGRHVEITKGIRDYAEKRLKKIENYFDFKENGEIHIIITVEKYRHIAEASLRSKRHEFSAKVETKDMYSSIDMLENKLLAQVKKHNEKVKKEGKTLARKAESLERSRIEGAPREQEDIIEEDLWAAKPMDTQEAMAEAGLTPDKTLLFYNTDFNRVCLIRGRKDGKFGLTISR